MGGDEAHFGLGGGESRAGAESGDDAKVVVGTVGIGVLGEARGLPECGGAGGEDKAAGHDANDGIGRVIKDDSAAEDGGVGAEVAAPEGIAQEDGARGFGSVVRRGEEAAHRGLHAEHGEEVASDGGALQALGIADSGQIQRDAGVGGHARV